MAGKNGRHNQQEKEQDETEIYPAKNKMQYLKPNK